MRDPKNDWPLVGALLLVALGLFVAAAVCSGAFTLDWLLKDAITVYTLVLALLTAGLVWVGYTQRQELERTAEHMTATERAYVFPAVRLFRIHHDALTGLVHIRFIVDVVNHGRTPAVLRRVRAYAQGLDDYPTELIDTPAAQDIPPGRVLGSKDNIQIDVLHRVDEAQWANIQEANEKLLCLGEVRYLDMHRVERVTGFCWELHHMSDGGNRTEIAPTDKLNHYT